MSTTKNPTKRGPYAPSRLRRERIAQAVLELVDELGYERVTTTLVSGRSGINEATVLYHFPTRDHLLVAAVQLADDQTAEQSGADSDHVDFRVETFTRGAPESEQRSRLRVMLRGMSITAGHPAFDYYRARTDHAIGIFGSIIRRRQEEGTAHPGLDADDVARQFVSMWEGLGTMKLLGYDFDLDELVRQGFRRLSGANWTDAMALLLGDEIGL